MLKKIILLMFLTITSCFSQVISTTKTYKAEGTGIGSTRAEAVNEAIVEAVGQISGVKIKKKTIIENLEVEDDKGERLSLKYNAKINKYTSGKADSFKILNINKTNDGLYKATVLVINKKVSKRYQTPGLNHNKRRSITVLPSNLNNDIFHILGERKTSIITNINLAQELLNTITQTRKFNVLDREEGRAFYSEQNLLQSEHAQKDEALKLGNILGADYLLLTSIKDINIEKDKTSKYIANASNSYISSITVQFKIITTATRQVKFSNTRTYNLNPEGKSNKEIYYNTLAQISNKISTELIENIYPIKIVNSKGGDITLNQGNLIVGSKYEVYSLGDKVIDSYTKESLGRKESKVGVIEIVRTLPKYSSASILEGKALKGNLVRSLYTSSKDGDSDIYNKIGSESDVKINKGGGVLLPFD